MRNLALVFASGLLLLISARIVRGGDAKGQIQPAFRTSDRCFPCHNELTTPSGRDVSIGLAWRSSIMANSARDPYWQASVRRETMDHPQAVPDIEDECSICHMPISRYQAKLQGDKGQVFAYLPFYADPKKSAFAEDGVTCAVCHQIGKQKLGSRESFNGGFVVENPPEKDARPEYGPFEVTRARQHIMDSSTGGFRPMFSEHIRDSALCGSCHQLYTTARGDNGKEIGYLPEQMPYLEWLHSDYPSRYSCQQCHMPEVHEAVRISSVLSDPRNGLNQHVFQGGNFFMQQMLNQYRNDLDVAALPQELTNAADATLEFLRTQSARIELRNVDVVAGTLRAEVFVQNLTGHKLPTAYPSRRAWVHFQIRDHEGKTIFESGALNADGSIQGNDNDADPSRFEPHYQEISSPDQVQIYEPILKDTQGHVTTGLLSAIGYFKDNRILPTGFDKKTADKDIAVIGDAHDDPDFKAGSDTVRYFVSLGNAEGPYRIEVELWYEPIGFRWAHNLQPYSASEPQRFISYYESMSASAATVLARTELSK
jgi:hypothetical protein